MERKQAKVRSALTITRAREQLQRAATAGLVPQRDTRERRGGWDTSNVASAVPCCTKEKVVRNDCRVLVYVCLLLEDL